MIEEWRPIDLFPGYLVSNMGRVRSGSGRIKSADSDRKGYLRVKLWSHGRPKNLKVHRLVHAAFNGQIPDGMVVRHCNGINTDNRAENLVVGTYAENESDKNRHGTALKGERHPMSRLTEDDVLAIRSRYVKGCPRNGTTGLARDFGVTAKTIWNIVSRRYWSHTP
ncbi:NUMOD4 motif-containing HNH endonuclease [Kerstersia similis]|uniref:NUMOD4 motif-containing HNH endonuclease n=1 Tax=Kerstersia similis TaxID=206505 RepID=UPI0039EE36C3